MYFYIAMYYVVSNNFSKVPADFSNKQKDDIASSRMA